ncbi:hypothetical protein REPUB_Repub20aG0107700 [Reevesia pubescens]
MAQSLTRAATSTIARHITISFLLPKRLLSTTSITNPPPIPSLLFSRRPLAPLSHAVKSLTLGPTRFTSIRCRVNRSGNSPYSPLNSGSNFSDRPPTEMAPLFPGCDYEHWLIVMDKPGGEGATKQEMIDCYIQTLAKVVGSPKEPKIDQGTTTGLVTCVAERTCGETFDHKEMLYRNPGSSELYDVFLDISRLMLNLNGSVLLFLT